MTFTGFAGALMSFLIGMTYLVYKILFWRSFSVGIAPVVIGMFFVSSILLVSMGVMGEYIGAIHTQIQRRPFAVERERVNFETPPQLPLGTESEASYARKSEANPSAQWRCISFRSVAACLRKCKGDDGIVQYKPPLEALPPEQMATN